MRTSDVVSAANAKSTMKIFAKRGKKKTTDDDTSSSLTRTTFKSDPIVEALLQKDPTSWNSKERRLVKRYRDRKQEQQEGDDNDMDAIVEEGKEKDEETSELTPTKNVDTLVKKDENDNDEKVKVDEGQQNDANGEDDSTNENDESSSSSDDDDDDDNVDEEKDYSDTEEEEEEIKDTDESLETATINDDKGQLRQEGAGAENQVEGKVDEDHKVWNLLNQLNSKQKRTLSRKLDRLGQTALEEVQLEAKQLLEATEAAAASDGATKKRDQPDCDSNDANDPDSSSTSNKKRKKQPDWSHLTAEERLRREEQRRKQQEATERRAAGADLVAPGHTRPLNSERRRANRRKPKWKKPTSLKAAISNEHNSSGYLIRRNVAGGDDGDREPQAA